MKKEYDKRLTILSDDINQKAIKIQAYKALAPSSYSLLDMTLAQILEGIKAMEKDPNKLWKGITKIFTRQFFDSIIEIEYKDYLNDVSQREMMRSINKIKKEASDQLNEVKLTMEAEKKSLRYQINMKIEENQYLRTSNLNMINRARRETDFAAEQKFKEREAQMFKKFDEEKQILFDELNSLKHFSENHNYLKEQFSMKLALVKFRYTVQIMRVREGQQEKPIRDIIDELRRVVMGKQIQENEERTKELENLKQEYEIIRIKHANDIYRLHEVTERLKLLEKSIQELQDENGSLSSQLSREREESRDKVLEIKSLVNSDKINKEIIEELEANKADLKDKVEQLSNQLKNKDPDFMPFNNLGDKNSKLFIKRTLQQMNKEKYESLREIISENVREIGIMTDIRGTENELVQNAYDEEIDNIPVIPKFNAIIQTDKELFNNIDPNLPLSDVNSHYKLNHLEAEVKRLRKLAGIGDEPYNPKMVDNSEEDSDYESESLEKTKKNKPKHKIKNKKNSPIKPKKSRKNKFKNTKPLSSQK